jgi:predicted ArsR family transcriptional regulator
MSASSQAERGEKTRKLVLSKLAEKKGKTADDVAAQMPKVLKLVKVGKVRRKREVPPHRNTIRLHLLELEKQGLAKKEEKGRQTYFFKVGHASQAEVNEALGIHPEAVDDTATTDAT